jgi:hypothetical protein
MAVGGCAACVCCEEGERCRVTVSSARSRSFRGSRLAQLSTTQQVLVSFCVARPVRLGTSV